MCETKYLTMSARQMPRQVRPPTVGQMKTGSPSQSTKVKPNMTRGSTSGSKVSTCKTTCYTKVVKNDVLLPNGTKSASPPTTKDSDKQNKHTHAEPESTSLTANRKLKSPQIMKKTLNKVSKSVDNSSRTLKCSSKITSRKEAKPTASRTEGDIPNNIVSELGDSLKQIDEKKKTQIKNNEPLPSSKQTIDKSSGAFKLQSKTSTQPVKTNSNSSVNVDSKTNTDNTRITRNIPIKRNTNVKDKTKGKYNKLSSSPKVTQSDFKPSTSTSSRASSRNGSKSPSPLVVKSSGNNGNTNVQSKCNRSHKSTSEAYYATNKQVVKVDPAQIKTSKQHIGSVTNRTRSRSSTPCSVTSSKSESNSSSTTSSDIKQRSLTSRDLMMKCVDDTCKQVEKKGTSRVSSASLNTVRIPQNVITKSKKEPVSNNDASETARTQAHLKTSQPFSKQKPQVASAQGAKCDSGLGKTHKNTSMPIEQTNKTSVPNVTELKREKGCSKTVVNSPKASQRITQAAMTVTDRLSKLPKSKTRASVNNKDSSSQLMSMAGKQKQSYSTVKQKRIKPILSESSEISTRESKTVHSSIISKKSIPVENHKLLIKSNTGAINKSNKPNIKRNYSESQSEKINEEQISETKKYTRNLHQNNSFEGDGCLHVHSAIDEDHTCTFCQKQEQTVCPCRLQSGVKTSHLSEELSNRNDLGYGLLTKKDFSSEAELISDGYLDGQRIMENNATNSVERGDYSCLTCDSTSNLTNDHLLDYCDICDANICKHTCKTRDTNDQKLDVDCHFINKLNDMSDSRDTRSDFGPCNNEMITSADVTNIKDEITNELMENQQMQVYRGTPCFERQQSHNENSLEHSLTPEGQEDKLTISYVCPNGESESNESDAPLTRKHKQFSVQLDNHYSLLNKHSQTETVSVTSKMISENELMHSEAFSFKSTSGQLHNISFLSDTKCISCKYFLDKCTCTSEKSENKVYLSKSDMNLAHNRHTGMVSSGNLCSNVCTRKSECKTNYYCKTLKMDGFLPGVGILAHLTSCKCNKMQNKLENVVVCGNNFDITHTKLPLQKTQFCSSNDITCHIKASLEDGGFNRNNVDTEINHKDAGLSKHMSLSEIDEKTPRSYVQDIPGSVLQTEHFHRNYSKEDTFETVEESCMHIDGHDTTEPVSMIDHSLQNTNLVQSHSWNIYKTPNAESFVNLLSVNMDNDNKLLLDKREVPTDKLTSTGDLIDGCKVRKSLESSVDPINVDLNEFCLSMGNESCTEYDLPSPESVMVTECPESCETQADENENIGTITSPAEAGITTYNGSYTDSIWSPLDTQNDSNKLNVVSMHQDSENDVGLHGQLASQRWESLPDVRLFSPVLSHKRRNSSGNIGNNSASDNSHFSSVQMQPPFDICISKDVCAESKTHAGHFCSLKELCIRFIKDVEMLLLDSAYPNAALSSSDKRSFSLSVEKPDLDFATENNLFSSNDNPCFLTEKIKSRSDYLHSENKNKELLPVAKQMSNTDSDVCFHTCSEIAKITGNSCNQEDHFYSNFSSSDITDLPESGDCCSGNYSRVGSIEEAAEEKRNSSVQVLNHENWELVKVTNENDCSVTSDECVTTGGHASNKEQLVDTSPCMDVSQVNALTINEQNRESGYFSNDQSQDDTLTCLSQNELHGHDITVSTATVYDDAPLVKRDISIGDATRQDCQANFNLSHSDDKTCTFQNEKNILSNDDKEEPAQNDIISKTPISSAADLPNQIVTTETWDNDDDESQNLTSYCDSADLEQQLNCALHLSNREIENEIIQDKINCLRLSNKNERSETLVSPYNEANDKNQISSLESQRVTSENLSEDSLHHDQTVCGQSNQIKVDKNIQDLKETSNFSDKHYGLSCMHGINRCQKCFKNLHISEKFNTYGQNIKEEDLHHLSGCLCIQQEYCDHVLDLCSENIIQEQISCSEASPKTSNVCYKSANCIYDISKDKTDDRTRSDLTSPENFETKQEKYVKDILYSKQNDKDFSQHDFHLKNNAISISNGENCESFCDPIRVLPGSYISVSDCKNVENHLAKRKFTDSSHAFRNKRSFSDSDIYARCFGISDNNIQGIYSRSSNDDSALHRLDLEAIPVDKSACENVNNCQEYTENCDGSRHLQCQDIVPYLPESSAYRCEDKGVCQDFIASPFDSKCDFESDALNATGVLINSSEQVDLSDISTYCSLHNQTGVAPIINSTKNSSETGVNCSINCQVCSSTCFKNVSINEQPLPSCHLINDNKNDLSSIGTPETASKQQICTNHRNLVADQNCANEVCKPSQIACEGGESLSDFISDEELYLHETSDTFVDTDDNFVDSDTDDINDLNNSTPNRNSLLYTESEQSTSVDSFQDAIDYFDYESDYTDDGCDNALNIKLCDKYKHSGICDNCHGAIYDDRLLQHCESYDVYSRQNTQTESTLSNSSNTDYFENSENTCCTDNCYLDSEISSNADNSPEKCTHKSLSVDSLRDSHLKINENKLGSINQFKDSSIQHDKNRVRSVIPSVEFASCKHLCTCMNNSESEVIRDVQSNMSQKDTPLSNDIGRDRPRVRAVPRSQGNCARSRYEELMKDRNQTATQSSPKSLRVRHSNSVLNSVNMLESKVTTQIQALSTTADVEDKIETAMTMRNERRRLRQLNKQISLCSSEEETVVKGSASLTAVQSEVTQHPSTEKVDNRDKEEVKTETSITQPIKAENKLHSSVENTILVVTKAHFDTSNVPHIIKSDDNTNALIETNGTVLVRNKPNSNTNSKAGQFVKMNSVIKSEIPLSTTRRPSGHPAEKFTDTLEKSFSTSSLWTNKNNAVQTISKESNNVTDQGSDTFQKTLPPAINVLPDRIHKEHYGVHINRITNDTKVSRQVDRNTYQGKCDVSILPNDSALATNTYQLEMDRAQKLSEHLPQASAERDTRLSQGTDCLVSNDAKKVICAETSSNDSNDKEQNVIDTANNVALFSHLTVTFEVIEDVCQILQGTDIREVSISAQEKVPLTFATSSMLISSRGSKSVQDVETTNFNSEKRVSSTSEICSEIVKDETVENDTSLSHSLSKIENVELVDTSSCQFHRTDICDDPDTDTNLSCSNDTTCENQKEISEFSNTNYTPETRMVEIDSHAMTEAYATLSTLSNTCDLSAKNCADLSITDGCEQLNTNLETISTSNNLKMSNLLSNESCLSMQKVDSRMKSAKIQENKDVIYSDSENTPLILSPNHDAVLCIQAHGVCSDKTGESLQLNENSFSNADYRLSNKLHKELYYDLKLHDVNNDSETSINDDGGQQNADCSPFKISNSEESQNVENCETASTKSASVVSLQETHNDTDGILCADSDADISFEVNIVDCIIDNERSVLDQQILEQSDSLTDGSLCADLSSISSIENVNQENISVLKTGTPTDSDLDYGSSLAINTVVDRNIDNSNYSGECTENKGRSNVSEGKEYQQMCRQYSLDNIILIQKDEEPKDRIQDRNDRDITQDDTTIETGQFTEHEASVNFRCSLELDSCQSLNATENISLEEQNTDNIPVPKQIDNMRDISFINDLNPVDGGPIDNEVCEDSNISVAMALRREKEKLSETSVPKPEKKLINRNFRRATTAIILQNRERKLENQTKCPHENENIMVHDEIVKSKCFQADNVSEFNTRENEANYNNKENETDDVIVSKKVSDICRTFSEKTQTNIVEIEQGPKLTPAVSPLPQRKHKSWVCKEGKWKRESFHEIGDDVIDIVTDNKSAISTDSQDLKAIVEDGLTYSGGEVGTTQIIEDHIDVEHNNFETANSNGFNTERINKINLNENVSITEHNEYKQFEERSKISLNEQILSNDKLSNFSISNELLYEMTTDSITQNEGGNNDIEKKDDILSLIRGEGIEYMDGVDHISSDSSESWYSTSSGDYEETPYLDNKLSNTSTCTLHSVKESIINPESALSLAARPVSLVALCEDALSLINHDQEIEKDLEPATCAELNNGPTIVMPPVVEFPSPPTKPNEIEKNTMNINENNICHRGSTNVEVVNGQDLSVPVNDIHKDKSKPSENTSNESSVATEDRVNEIIKTKVKKKPMVPLPSKLPYGKQTRVSTLEDAHKDISIVNQYSQETSRNVEIMQHEQTADKKLPIAIDTCIPKQIPKLKAVKIKEEEIYEGKPEYTKECNLHPLGIELSTRESLVKVCVEGEQMLTDLAKLHNEFTQMSTDSEKLHVESNQMPTESITDAVIKKRIPTSAATRKHMVKSKTFSAFQDLRNKSDLKLQTQKCDLKTSNATRTPAQSVCKIPKPKSCIESTTDSNDKGDLRFDQKRNFDSIKRIADTNKKENAHERKHVNKLTRTISLPDTSLVYGKIPTKTKSSTKKTDEPSKAVTVKKVSKIGLDADSELNRGREEIPASTRSDGDDTKNTKKCERSKSLQRNKLLSEIAEVEESRDDNISPRSNRGPNSAIHDEPSLEPRVKRPVTRSNKRRSLSLPTGTLAFGEARIVYKNGHFTIETMDGTELDSSELTNKQSYYISNQDQTPNQNPCYNRPPRTPARMLPEPHSNLQREIIMERPHLRRQVGKTVLTRNELIDKGDKYKSNLENVSPNQKYYNQQNLPSSSMCSKEKVDSSFISLNSSKQSLNQSSESLSYSEQMELDDDYENASHNNRPVRYHSSSSLLDSDKDEIKRVAQRARRTSSFRQAQEQGSCRLSGIIEDKDHVFSKRRTVSLDESQNTDLNQSSHSQSPNQNTNFFQRMMAKRKSSMENFNLSSFAKQSESAKDFFSKKMTLKGLFRKNRSDSPANSPLRTKLSSSPPVSVFIEKDDSDPKMASEPNTPYKSKDMRRRHTSADLFANAFKHATPSSHPNSNCNTPTRDRDAFFRTNSTPGMEASFIVRTDKLTPSRTPSSSSVSKSTTPTPDEDQLSIKSASSATSSVHSVQSPPLEQPHKPKTPKPVGTSPRRYPSGSSQSSQSARIFSFRDRDRSRTMSATSLESENSEIVFEDFSELKCECENLTPTLARASKSPNTSSSSVFPVKCELCGKYTAELFKDPHRLKKFTIGPDSSEDHDKLRKDLAGRLALLVQSEISASNSNDSGIQHDVSVHSSSESLKGTPESKVRLRRQKSSSPRPERPKSEIGVRWADLDTQEYEITTTPVRRRDRSQNIKDRPRPKSDFDDNIQLFDELFLEVLEDFETDGSSFFSHRMKAFGSEINLQPYCSLRNLYEMRRRDWENSQAKNRRMSTPHPIKSRLQRTPKRLVKQAPLVRSSSMPESLDKVHKRRKLHHLLDFHEASLSKHLDPDEYLSDDSDLSFDHISLQEKSLSVQSSQSQLTSMDEEEDNLTYAEALWDHITMDPEELGFRAGDLINVFDMSDKDWWFGEIEDREGWFPAAFVRLRVNQDQFEEELEVTLQPELSASPKLRRISTINKVQARTNVVNEIISAEREYVKHLKDVVEGYIQHARKRHEMFPEERLSLIFGNIENIYVFAQKFLSQLEMCIDVCPHLSEVGQCFLDNEKGFEIYSDYCNNHPSACEELKDLYRNAKYRHFFEACRLLQELVEIPLEGFLLTPVQKICKYPLQLAELLKYTPPEHADYLKVKAALSEMRKIATLINERKRKMESIEKIAAWQHTVADWEGEDLLERSSELIFSGDINKINSAGWSQERYFFLFDHQLIYCKKELLKRHVFSYKGRIDLDHCDIIPLSDGKDTQYNVTVKHGWKLHETHKDKWYLLYTKTETGKDRWLKALTDERKRVREDQENDFCVPEHWKQTVLNKVRSQSSLKEKHHSRRPTPDSHIMLQKDFSNSVPYATLPRIRRSSSQKPEKKKGWFNFGGKKSKR